MTPLQPELGGAPAESPLVASAREALNLPSVLLLAVASLSLAWALFGLATGGATAEQLDPLFKDPNIPPEWREYRPLLETLMNRWWSLIPLVLNGLIAAGAWRMRQVRSWGFSVTAAVLAALPCCASLCCVLGLPVGVWAVGVLTKPEVKAAFAGR